VKYLLYSTLYFAAIVSKILPAQAQQHLNTSALPIVIDKSSLQGKITDAKTGESLAGASVYVHDIKTGAVADVSGNFHLRNLSEGRYLVEISHLGYKSVIEIIEMKGQVKKDFALEPSIIENDAVTVTGVSAATKVRKTTAPVTIIKKENLLQGVSTNLIDALSKTPGVSQISTGPAISKPSIRGLGYNRLVVVNDGIRQEGQQWGDEHGIEIDEYNVSKAEVLKGPASIIYGSDALAGVVNIISFIPAPMGTVKGRFFGNYQSNNRLRGLHGEIGGNKNGFIWGAYGSYKTAADYRNKYDGYVFNSRYNEKNFGGYLGLNKKWGYTHLLISSFNQEPGLIEGERDSITGKFIKQVNNNGAVEEAIATDVDFKSTNPLIPRQNVQHFKITSDNNLLVGKDRISLTLGYQRNQRQEFGDVVNPDKKDLFFDLNTINYNFQYHFTERHQWKTSMGVNGMQQFNKNKGIEQIIPEYSLFDIGGFVYTQHSFKNLTLSGGLRIDNRSIDSKELLEGVDVKFASFNNRYTNISGSVGISYEVSDKIVWKFNIARGFRAPGMSELASNGAHEGTNRYEYGENDLKSEKSLQVDGGIELNNEHISLNTTVFFNSISNFIYYRKLSSESGTDSIIVDGSDELLAFRFDQNNAKLYGLEMNLDIHPHPLDWLHIENSFSYVRGLLNKEQDGSKNLSFIPAARLINELRANLFKKGKSFRNFYLKLELDNTFAQRNPFTGYNTETTTSGYSLLNMGTGFDLWNSNRVLFSIYLGATNITDVGYQHHLSRLKYAPKNFATGRTGVYNMGRNFSIKLNIPLSFKTAD
jgi:iron complex outermembrane recepter protein